MRKRLLSILLLCCMVLTLLPTTALAEEAAPAFDLATDLADITIPNDLVTCVCTKASETKQYGQLTDGFSATKVAKEGNVWTVIIYVENSIYKAEFDKDTGSTHSPDMNHFTDFKTPIQFELKYEGGKWVLLGEMPQNKMLHFTCSGGHVYQGAAPTIELVSKTYTDIKVTENSAWEYSIDNEATWQGSCHFTNLRPGTEYTIIARVKETATHQPSANSAPLKISTIGSAITEDDFAGLNIPANLVTVKCQTTGDSKAYGRIPGGFDLSNSTPYMENGVLKAIVQLNLPAYRDKYNADTKKTHEDAGLEGNPHITFTLKYVNNKWELDGTFPNVIILVKCDGPHPQTPPYPTEENVSGLEQVRVRVQCSTDTAQFKNYGILPGSVSIMPDANDPSQATLTLIPSVYSKQYSTDTGITHSVAPNQATDNLKIQMRYDPAVGKWMPAGELTPLVIYVKCNSHDPQTPPYPTEENVSGLEQVQVRVQCSTDRTQFKNYGILPGSVSIVPDSNNPSQATLTLIPSVYSKQYTIDTGITHSVAPNQNTDNLKIQMRYNSAVGKWMPAGELTPLEVLVQCNNHQGQRYTITFNGNGGTLSVTSMTTIDQKLPELPTATHSGRYSFDGWYTAASGGTKITTATVFYENTTVYAHWTYIGGGGSSGGGGGGGGHTYHTIRAISGLNGSISPSGWTSVRHGWDQTFTITPDKGYAVAKVLVDGKSVGSVKSYTFKNVTKDHTIEVVFVKGTASPSTGDSSNLPLWSALLLASTLTLAGTVHYKRKRAR